MKLKDRPGETDPIMRYDVILASTTKATRWAKSGPKLSFPEYPCWEPSPSENMFDEPEAAREPSSSAKIALGELGMLASWRTDAGSITFTAHPNLQAKDAAAWSCNRSACNVVASSATVAFSLETTKTAYNNLNNRLFFVRPNQRNNTKKRRNELQ